MQGMHGRTRKRRGGSGAPRRRDRHGRGLRGHLAAAPVPLHRTRAQGFDALVLDAVDAVEQRWGAELADVEFAVEDVPADVAEVPLDHDVVRDRGVPLGRLFRGGLAELTGNAGVAGAAKAVIVVYRRPIEARAAAGEDRGELVFTVVVDLAAEFLGKNPEDVDPPH